MLALIGREGNVSLKIKSRIPVKQFSCLEKGLKKVFGSVCFFIVFFLTSTVVNPITGWKSLLVENRSIMWWQCNQKDVELLVKIKGEEEEAGR